MSSAPVEETALVAVVHQSGLELESQQKLIASFQPLFDQAEEWRQKVATINITDVSQTREMRLARETRLALKDIRVKADKARKTMKEDVLRRGKAIDGVYNTLAFLIEPLEEHLLAQEKFAERKEEERRAQLKIQREEILRPYGIDMSVYLLDAMSDETFANLLSGTKAAADAKIETAKKAEADRLAKEAADLAERERIRLENKRLKAEAEAARVERERVAEETRKRESAAEAERQRIAAEAKAERDRIEAEAKKEREQREAQVAEEKRIAAEAAAKERAALEAKAKADREEAEVKARVEREAREKAEAELRKQQEAEKKRKADEERARKAAAAAGDKEKLVAAAAAVDKATPTLKDAELQDRILHLFADFIQKLKQEHDAL